jgi:hypothetical protein
VGLKIETKLVSVTPTIVPAAYAANDQIGATAIVVSEICMESGGLARINSIAIIDKAKQKAAIDLFIFSELPTVASGDNAPADVSDSELASKCLGVISIAAGDYADLANASVASKQNLNLLAKCKAGSKDLYVLPVSRGTPTYASASDLTIRIGVAQ